MKHTTRHRSPPDASLNLVTIILATIYNRLSKEGIKNKNPRRGVIFAVRWEGERGENLSLIVVKLIRYFDMTKSHLILSFNLLTLCPLKSSISPSRPSPRPAMIRAHNGLAHCWPGPKTLSLTSCLMARY